MKHLFLFITAFALGLGATLAQNNHEIFERLHGISQNGIDFFNIDGIEITSQTRDIEFNERNISKTFKPLKIKRKELIISDPELDFKNFVVSRTENFDNGIAGFLNYYFVESKDNRVIGVTFTSINKNDKDFERAFVRMVRDQLIPDSIFSSFEMDSVNFAGRRIKLGSSCRWMGINNVQCPFYGQMNWSVHKEFDDAVATKQNQLAVIKSKPGTRIILDEIVEVVFEGTETTAQRVILDFTGARSALVGMSGGKTLTIYFIAAPVRQNFVSCVMSFWNNDQINPGGLSPLLEQVMSLK